MAPGAQQGFLQRVLGDGNRLFDRTNTAKPMRLIETRQVGDGLVYYAYEFLRNA
ncbi:hypothetical protein ACIRRA_36345 [Nocardia sp. NPDC101769]|uniref:hypothetical protein n=1 Tax=Nocardia sp. NPDC101769 TaxID=3364333 RepID=UPI00381E6BA3